MAEKDCVLITVNLQLKTGKWTQRECLLIIPAGTSEGEILDAISRNTCEAYRLAKLELENET